MPDTSTTTTDTGPTTTTTGTGTGTGTGTTGASTTDTAATPDNTPDPDADAAPAGEPDKPESAGPDPAAPDGEITGHRSTTDTSPADALPTAASNAAPSAATDAGGKAADAAALADRVWSALWAHPGATAAELAVAAHAGRSTVRRLLAGWAREGLASSSPTTDALGTDAHGSHADEATASGRGRAARSWTAAPDTRPSPPPPAPSSSTLPTPASSSARSSTTPGAATGAAGSSGDRAGESARMDSVVASDSTAVPGAAPTATATATAPTALTGRGLPGRSRRARLAPGGLRGLVEEFLSEHRGEHSPVAIARSLGRSSGAVANALEKLVDTGWARRTMDKPKRYRIADDGPHPITESDERPTTGADDS